MSQIVYIYSPSVRPGVKSAFDSSEDLEARLDTSDSPCARGLASLSLSLLEVRLGSFRTSPQGTCSEIARFSRVYVPVGPLLMLFLLLVFLSLSHCEWCVLRTTPGDGLAESKMIVRPSFLLLRSGRATSVALPLPPSVARGE